MSISAIRFFSNLSTQKASNRFQNKVNSSPAFKGYGEKKEIQPGEAGYGSGAGHYENRPWVDCYPEDWDGPKSGAGYTPVWVPDSGSSGSSYGNYYAGSGD